MQSVVDVVRERRVCEGLRVDDVAKIESRVAERCDGATQENSSWSGCSAG